VRGNRPRPLSGPSDPRKGFGGKNALDRMTSLERAKGSRPCGRTMK
jgi:hypothetical protein